MRVLYRILGLLLAGLTAFVSTGLFGMTAFSDRETAAFTEKTDGFIAGVCHPDTDYDAICGANLGWVREDLPVPVDADGNVTLWYQMWKEEMRAYVDRGIKLYVITPNPRDYLAFGIDFRTPEGEALIRSAARFLMEDLQGFASAVQVANEQGVDRFTLPFTMDQSARFIGVQLEEMYPLREDIVIGYNLGGPGFWQLPLRMRKYADVTDYIGVDLYLGSFDPVTKTLGEYTALLRLVRVLTRKPIILSEFGYIGYGESKSELEKMQILQQYGFSTELQARADIDTFISRLPDALREEIERNYAGLSAKEKGDLVFNTEYAQHIYKELGDDYQLYRYPHSPDGQADFYKDLIPKIKKLSFVTGMFIYCWSDSDHCYVCGQPDCPVETGWGLVDGQGVPKPAFYAVRDALA